MKKKIMAMVFAAMLMVGAAIEASGYCCYIIRIQCWTNGPEYDTLVCGSTSNERMANYYEWKALLCDDDQDHDCPED